MWLRPYPLELLVSEVSSENNLKPSHVTYKESSKTSFASVNKKIDILLKLEYFDDNINKERSTNKRCLENIQKNKVTYKLDSHKLEESFEIMSEANFILQ